MAECELIVVANGCTDNTRWYLDRLSYQFASIGFADHFKVVWHDSALGFSKACNAGIRAAAGERIILLNNDVILLPQQPHTWIERLNSPFEQDNQVGITSTLQLFSKETNRNFAVFFCVMIDRKVLNQIGLLNEEYGVGGGEDIEYCMEAEKAGFKIVAVAKTEYKAEIGTNSSDFPIWHKAEGTMHDPQLVPNWHEIFQGNMNKLAVKYQTAVGYNNPRDVAAAFDWLSTVDEESSELFQEVLINNIYQVNAAALQGRSVIDVGANRGMFSILSAALGATRVIAAEPISSSFALLQQNIARSNFLSRVNLVQRAVVGKPSAPLSMGLNNKSGHNSFYKPGEQIEIVATVALEKLIEQCDSDNIFLKLDCEGAEYDILFDSPPHIFQKVKTIAVEIHGDLHPVYKGLEPLQNKLTDLGYRNVMRTQIGMWWYGPNGEPTRFDPLPLTVEKWERIT
jgi:FkbM family methyltransferase